MKFAIAGAGAMGCRFAYQLHKAGYEVQLIDTWKDHVEKIKEEGLTVDYNGTIETVRLPISYPTDVHESVDVVIVLTKAMQLSDMLNSIQSMFTNKTAVVCLLNGIGHEEVMKQYVPVENIVMGTTIWTAGLKSPGNVLLHGIGGLSLQNFYTSDEAKDTTEKIVAILNEAELCAQYSADVKSAIWKKACLNGCANATTALLDCNLDQFFNHQYTQDVVSAIVQEFSAVAKTQDVGLDVEEITTFVIEASRKVGEHYASMHQDLVQNKRLTEVDYINGAVSRIGKLNGIATPVCDLITQMIHIKETVIGAK